MSSIKAPVRNIQPEVVLRQIVPLKWMSAKYTNCIWTFYHMDPSTTVTSKKTGTVPDTQAKQDRKAIKIYGKTYSSEMYDFFGQDIMVCDKNDQVEKTGFTIQRSLVPAYYLGFYEAKPTYSYNCLWTIYEPADIESYDQIFVLDEFGSIIDLNLSNNDSITMNSSEKRYPPGKYKLTSNGVLICESPSRGMWLDTTVVDDVMDGW